MFGPWFINIIFIIFRNYNNIKFSEDNNYERLTFVCFTSSLLSLLLFLALRYNVNFTQMFAGFAQVRCQVDFLDTRHWIFSVCKDYGSLELTKCSPGISGMTELPRVCRWRASRWPGNNLALRHWLWYIFVAYSTVLFLFLWPFWRPNHATPLQPHTTADHFPLIPGANPWTNHSINKWGEGEVTQVCKGGLFA